MNNKREDLLQRMDLLLSTQKDKINSIKDSEIKEELYKVAEAIEDLQMKIQMDESLKNRADKKRMNIFYTSLANIFKGKYLRTMLLAFIAGLIVALIPTLIYINSMKDDSLAFQFVPNAMAIRKPVYLQIINTPEQLKEARQADIYTPDTIEIGDGVGLGATGLGIYKKKQLELPDMHIEKITPQINKKILINGYEYIPNAILTADPLAIQVVENIKQLQSAQKMQTLTYKDFLSVGAAIACPKDISCYVLGKSGLSDRFAVKYFQYSRPE